MFLAIFLALSSIGVFAVEADIFEPDNNFTNAKDISTDGTLQGHTFHVEYDEDWLKLNVEKDKFYLIETWNLSRGIDSADTIVYLYEADGSTRIVWDDDSGEGLASKLIFKADAAGLRYLEVREFSGSSGGNYSIYVSQIQGILDSFEPDDSFEKANSINVNDSGQIHNIFPNNDTDFIKFNAKKDTFYNITVSNLSSGLYATVILYDADGVTKLASGYKSYEGAAVFFSADEDGTYFVEISGIKSSSSGGGGGGEPAPPEEPTPTPTPPESDIVNDASEIGISAASLSVGTGIEILNYTVSVWETSNMSDKYEADNEPALAREITTDKTAQTHNFFPSNDEDWLKFNAIEGNTYIIETANLQGGADTRLSLYKFGGDYMQFIDSNDNIDKNNLSSRIVYAADSSGILHVSVRDVNNKPLGSYDISVRIAGVLAPAIIKPSNNMVVPKNGSFEFISNVTCENGDCGKVDATLYFSRAIGGIIPVSIELNEDIAAPSSQNEYSNLALHSKESYGVKVKSALESNNLIGASGHNPAESEIKLESVESYGADTYVKYSQRYKSLQVYGSVVKALVRNNKIVGVNNNFYNDINLDTNPKISKGEAENIALISSNLQARGSEMAVFPKNSNYFLAWKVDVLDPENAAKSLRVIVDAESGSIIEIIDLIIYHDLSGTVTGMIFSEHPGQQQAEKFFANELVRITDNDVEKALDKTSKEGKYSATGLSGDVKIESSLEGPFVKVINEDKPESAETRHSFNGTGKTLHDWNWKDSDSSDRQEESNMFYHVNLVHDYFTKGAPFNISAMDYQIAATVEVDNNFCNAFYNSYLKNIFFGNSNDCGNLALMSDVIYHEYTHAVVDHVYTEGALDSFIGASMHEGYADYFASTINGNSCMSEGFLGEECLRDVDNTLKIDELGTYDPHIFGLPFAGSLWDLRETVGKEKSDSLAIKAMQLEPVTMEDFLNSLLVVDDNNANLNDGTPHQEEICRAFSANHHIKSAYCEDEGAVPANAGAFFYTSEPNPSNDSCLLDILKDDVCTITWRVNMSNAPKGKWNFFALYSSLASTASTQNTTITIAGGPSINPIILSKAAEQGALFSFNVTSSTGSNPGAVKFSTSNSTKYSIEHISDTAATISFMPTNNDVPIAELTVFVADSMGLTDSRIARIQVSNINDAPVIGSFSPSFANPKIHGSRAMEFNVVASDIDEKYGDALTITWSVNGKLNSTGNKLALGPGNQAGNYTILSNVTDKENASASKKWLLTVAERPIADTFDAKETTDFSAIADLSNVPNVSLGKKEGSIRFKESLDLRFAIDIDNLVSVSKGLISIDSAQLPELSKPAALKMKGLDFVNTPIVMMDEGSGFEFCPETICANITYFNGTLEFDVAHFSAFKAVENTAVEETSMLAIKSVRVLVDGNSKAVRSNGLLDNVKPGSELEFKIKMENLFGDANISEIEDIETEMLIEGIDNGDDFEGLVDEFDIDAGKSKEIRVRFRVPLNVEEDTYRAEIISGGKDINRYEQKARFNFDIAVEKKNHEVSIGEISLRPSKADCSKNAVLNFEVINTGSSDEDNAAVEIISQGLGFSYGKEFALGEGDDDRSIFSGSVKIPISEKIAPGTYPIDIKAHYNSGEPSNQKTALLEVGECVVKKSTGITETPRASLREDNFKILPSQSVKAASQQAKIYSRPSRDTSLLDSKSLLTLFLINYAILIGLIIFLAWNIITGRK